MLPFLMIATAGKFALHMFYVIPLFDEGRFLVGCTLVVGYAGVFYLLIPQYFMRRSEYRADELAVKLLGDRQPLIDGLLKFAELNDEDLDLRGGSHPSMNQRIAAIRQVPLPTDGAS